MADGSTDLGRFVSLGLGGWWNGSVAMISIDQRARIKSVIPSLLLQYQQPPVRRAAHLSTFITETLNDATRPCTHVMITSLMLADFLSRTSPSMIPCM